MTFSLPDGVRHTAAQFEALTGYMPPKFNTFWQFYSAAGKLKPLELKRGEIKNPVVLATADGKYAMGIYAPSQPQPDTRGPGYGRWYFEKAQVAKWNCVYRVQNTNGIPAGDYRYRMLVPFGTVTQVETMLREWQSALR